MPQDALKFYDLFKETRFSASMAGQMEINDYLLLTGQYKKVVMANNMFFDITNNTDSTASYRNGPCTKADKHMRKWATTGMPTA